MLIEFLIVLVLAGIGIGTAKAVMNDSAKKRSSVEDLRAFQRKHDIDITNVDDLCAQFAALIDIAEEQVKAGEKDAVAKLAEYKVQLQKAEQLKELLKTK
jgi:uncharacterized protein (DUF305 family)